MLPLARSRPFRREGCSVPGPSPHTHPLMPQPLPMKQATPSRHTGSSSQGAIHCGARTCKGSSVSQLSASAHAGRRLSFPFQTAENARSLEGTAGIWWVVEWRLLNTLQSPGQSHGILPAPNIDSAEKRWFMGEVDTSTQFHIFTCPAKDLSSPAKGTSWVPEVQDVRSAVVQEKPWIGAENQN